MQTKLSDMIDGNNNYTKLMSVTLTITTLTILCLIQVPIIYIDDKLMVIWSVILLSIFLPLGCHYEYYEVSKSNQKQSNKEGEEY